MNLKAIYLILILISAFSFLSAQESNDYVDVKNANMQVAKLEQENSTNSAAIAANNERKAFLEDRIKSTESRLSVIEENLGYTQQTNLELNALKKETKDRETLAKLEASWDELRGVIWVLTTEKSRLTEQLENDRDEVDFLARDTNRRQSINERNSSDIATLKQSVSSTESKINEISSQLDTIISKIEGFREEVTTESTL
ncbi:MAG: hypothetical protein JEY99_03815 [Spirochaetales bacterium]|nr:hypothetical protein [Spirochaetales bacterium]